MTLMQVQAKLGEQIEFFTNEAIPLDVREQYIEVGLLVSSLTKQFINGADVALRHDKLYSEGKLKADSASTKLIGNYEVQH